jgi:cytochrome c553
MEVCDIAFSTNQRAAFMRSLLLITTFLALMLTACTSATDSAQSLPPGDATRGAALFTESINGAPACSTCHSIDGTSSTGPTLKGFAPVAGTRVSGLSAREYAYQSIVQPATYLVSRYGNLMYNQYAQRLSAQQIADLIAYLLTL